MTSMYASAHGHAAVMCSGMSLLVNELYSELESVLIRDFTSNW